jgi:hypothetical protein
MRSVIPTAVAGLVVLLAGASAALPDAPAGLSVDDRSQIERDLKIVVDRLRPMRE